MRAEEFEIARGRMLAEISARAGQLRETTGRAAYCAGPDATWVKPLYDSAFKRASDEERAMALVYLEDWLKGRRE